MGSLGCAICPEVFTFSISLPPTLWVGCWVGALLRLCAFPDSHRGQLSIDESWLHLGCHRMFSSKYGSAGSKWSSELITNGLKSQSHLRNSHVQPASSPRVWLASTLGSETRDGLSAAQRLLCSSLPCHVTLHLPCLSPQPQFPM